MQLRRHMDREGGVKVKPEAAMGSERASQVMQAEVFLAKVRSLLHSGSCFLCHRDACGAAEEKGDLITSEPD